MLSDQVFQTALDLMRAFASATEENQRLQNMAQLLTIEQNMSLVEQCEYAMALCAEVNELTIEDTEKETKLSAVALETVHDESLKEFITNHRAALIDRFYNKAVAAAAHKALSAVHGDANAMKTIGEIILAATPTPKRLMN